MIKKIILSWIWYYFRVNIYWVSIESCCKITPKTSRKCWAEYYKGASVISMVIIRLAKPYYFFYWSPLNVDGQVYLKSRLVKPETFIDLNQHEITARLNEARYVRTVVFWSPCFVCNKHIIINNICGLWQMQTIVSIYTNFKVKLNFS